MENINIIKYKKIRKSKPKLSSLLNPDLSTSNTSIKNDLIISNTTRINNSFNYSKSNNYIISKTKIQLNKNIPKFPNYSLKSDLLNISIKPNNNKVDSSTQKDYYPTKMKRITKIKPNLLKNLVEIIPKKNIGNIDYILESPHRGVEKIKYSTPVSNNKDKKIKSFFSPIYENNTYKGYFCKNNKSNLPSNFLYEIRNNPLRKNKKRLFMDKYEEINKNKKIENPLKRLSKISGVSSYKLRQLIDYGLNHDIKTKIELLKKKLEKEENLSDNNRYINKNKIYSFIALKPKKNKKLKIINEYSNDITNGSLENVIYAKKFKDVKINKKDVDAMKSIIEISKGDMKHV